MIEKCVEQLSKSLLHISEERSPIGLADGKMGVCIYLFHLSRIENNEEYRHAAENILESIFKAIHLNMHIGVKDGLGGIGLGVSYLVKQGFTKGNINTILQDIDDVIFKKLSYDKNSAIYSSEELVWLLYYLYVRLTQLEQYTEASYLFKELCIQTISNIYKKLDLSSFAEPPHYDSDYFLPQLLFVLSRIYSLDFHSERIKKLLEELQPVILSSLPTVHANRLYLLLGINSILSCFTIKEWEEYGNLLWQNINIDRILNDELGNKNIYIGNGYAGVYLLIHAAKEFITPDVFDSYRKTVLEKIECSKEWDLLMSNASYFASHRGIINGFSGVSLIYLLLKNAIL